MPAATTLAVIGLGLAAAGTAYQVKQSADAASEAQDQAKKQAEQQAAITQEAANKKKQEEAQQQMNQARAVAGQGSLGARRDNIYTSPLGVMGNPLGAGAKTAIGS